MHFRTFAVAIGATLISFASASPRQAGAQPARPNAPSHSFVQPSHASNADSRCYTRAAPTPNGQGSLPTSHSTIYTSCTSTVTNTKSTTVIPPKSTVTVTLTSSITTTIAGPTATETSTNSETATNTETVTTTTTTTTTTTSSVQATSTIPAPAAFVPIQDSLPGSGYDGNYGGTPVGKRSTKSRRVNRRDLAALPELNLDTRGASRHHLSNTSYPLSVNCYTWTTSAKCSATATTTTSTITASTPTTTVTSTKTTTVTSVTSATTTTTTSIVITTTTTTTSTEIDTATATTTTTTSTTLLYAACATANIADTYTGGQYFQGAYYADSDGYSSDNSAANTAYDCCVAAFTSPDSIAFWTYSPGGGDNACQAAIVDSGTCSVASNGAEADVSSNEGFAIGNGPCGAFVKTCSTDPNNFTC